MSDFDENGKVIPNHQDVAKVESQYGSLPPNASKDQCAHRYNLYQAQALLRLHEEGKL